MPKTKHSVLLVSSQPIQNAASLQTMAEDRRLDMLTAYCSLPDAKLWRDQEHLTKEAFDLPMLEGYPWVRVSNYSPFPRLGKFYGLINPGLIRLVSSYDCCIVYGHAYISFWLAIGTAKIFGKPLLLGTDATESRFCWALMPRLFNRTTAGRAGSHRSRRNYSRSFTTESPTWCLSLRRLQNVSSARSAFPKNA
jgi:hypothetical protein